MEYQLNKMTPVSIYLFSESSNIEKLISVEQEVPESEHSGNAVRRIDRYAFDTL